MKKIGIDARFLGPKGKGLGRYVQKLLEYLEGIDGGSAERRYFVFLKKENFNLYQPQHDNFKKVEANFHWYTFGEQLKFPNFLNSFNLDLMHFAHFNVPLFYRKKFIVTVHDLILFHYPTVKNTTLNKYFYFFKLLAYQTVIRSAVKRAQKIIAVSNYTKKDILKNLSVVPAKVEVIYEGCDYRCYVSRESVDVILKKYGIMKPYLLYVGNAYPHKNLERLVDVYKKIKKKHPDLNLVLVGGRDYFYDGLAEFVQKKGIHGVVFPGFVSDVELDLLYREAELYVFPSLYEGFGLPPLEALAKCTPVASSKRTSMPEVLGDMASYFDPEDESEMTEVLLKMLKSKTKKVPIEDVCKQMKKFDWERMAKETLEIYKECLD